MSENLVWIGWAFQELVSTNKHTSPPPKKSLLALIHPEVAYNNRKHLKIWESAVFSGLNFIKIIGIWIFRMGGRNPLLGGLHVTCDAHFRTRLSCSSQKSCVKIWFRLVEIGGTWLFRGGRSPLLEGVTCDLRCPPSNLAKLFQSKVMFENLVRIGWAFQELSCPQTNIHKKK